MTIGEIIALLETQITTLNSARATAERLGDINRIIEIDGKIQETQATLAALKGL